MHQDKSFMVLGIKPSLHSYQASAVPLSYILRPQRNHFRCKRAAPESGMVLLVASHFPRRWVPQRLSALKTSYYAGSFMVFALVPVSYCSRNWMVENKFIILCFYKSGIHVRPSRLKSRCQKAFVLYRSPSRNGFLAAVCFPWLMLPTASLFLWDSDLLTAPL